MRSKRKRQKRAQSAHEIRLERQADRWKTHARFESARADALLKEAEIASADRERVMAVVEALNSRGAELFQCAKALEALATEIHKMCAPEE